jgi:hypothetical protein
VDSYLLHQECTGGRYSQHWFYQLLIKDLLENGFAEDVETRSGSAEKAKKFTSLVLTGWSASQGLHITPTKQTMEGSVSSTKKFRQSWCRSCDAKTIMVCSECQRDLDIGKIGAVFFVTHCQVGCATASICTNRIDFPSTNSLICVSFTFYSISVLSCFDLFSSKCLIVSIMSVEKVRPSKIQNSKKGSFFVRSLRH